MNLSPAQLESRLSIGAAAAESRSTSISSSCSTSSLSAQDTSTATSCADDDDDEEMRQPKRQQKEDASSCSSATSSCKRYKNSPFGLTNHFVAMPDVVQQATRPTIANFYLQQQQTGKQEVVGRNQLEQVKDEDEDEESEESADDEDAERRNLSVLTSLPATSSENNASDGLLLSARVAPAQGYGADKRRRRTQRHQSAAYTATVRQQPAGDAGLDAPKCNSKAAAAAAAAETSYPPPAGHAPQSLLHRQARWPPNKPYAASREKLANYKEEDCASSSLLVLFSSIMYATFLVILGCILHVS